MGFRATKMTSLPKMGEVLPGAFCYRRSNSPLNFKVQKLPRGHTFVAHVDKLTRYVANEVDEITKQDLDSPVHLTFEESTGYSPSLRSHPEDSTSTGEEAPTA